MVVQHRWRFSTRNKDPTKRIIIGSIFICLCTTHHVVRSFGLYQQPTLLFLRPSNYPTSLHSSLRLYDTHRNIENHDRIRETNDATTLLTSQSHFYPYPRFQVHENLSTIQNILVCGDGDFSYSASIAPICQSWRIPMTATVLEDEMAHLQIYPSSRSNVDTILNPFPEHDTDNHTMCHQVFFGIDATKLRQHFTNTTTQTFDRIVFNFPHWRGKTNHKRNRALLDSFFASAVQVLPNPNGGEIHISLCEGQGGHSATTVQEWKDSWMIATIAAENGLLLVHTEVFKPTYHLSAFRGRNKGFHVGENPNLYIFARPNGSTKIPQHLQLCCRQELHILLPDYTKDETSIANHVVSIHDPSYTYYDIEYGDAIAKIIQAVVPEGIKVLVPARKVWKKKDTGSISDIAIYLVVYCGEMLPMARGQANEYRRFAEEAIEKIVPLRENRKGRLVSKPFPFTLLDYVLRVHSSYGHMKDSYEDAHDLFNVNESYTM